MTPSHTPAYSPSKGTRGAMLERIEADLGRIVGSQGSQALLERSRQLCGSRDPSGELLLHNLMQLVRKLLGKPLAQWLQQSARAMPRATSERARLR